MEVASGWLIRRNSFSGYDSGRAVMAELLVMEDWCSSGDEDG